MRNFSFKLICVLGLLIPVLLSAQIDQDLARLIQEQDFNKERLDSIYGELVKEQKSYTRDSLITEVYYSHASNFFHSQELDSTIYQLYKTLPYLHNENPRKAKVYELLGTSIYKNGNPEKAIHYYDTTLSLAKQFNNLPLQITVLNRSSVLYNELGNREKEIEVLKRAITLADSTKSSSHQGTIRINLGIIFIESGLYESAINSVTEAITYLKQINDSQARATYLTYAYSNLGDIYAQLHQYDTAIALCNKALEYTTDKDVFMRAYIANSLASTYIDLKQYDKAKKELDFAYPILSESPNAQAKIGVSSAYANALLKTGNYELAQTICENVIPFADTNNIYNGLIDLHSILAKAFMYQNQLTQADSNFSKVLIYQDSLRIQFQDEEVALLKVEYDIAQSELENKWLKEENLLKDNIIKSSRVIILITVLALLIFGGLIIVINRNRRQLKKQQLELKGKNEELKESNQNNERILSLIAHDVKGPLASLEALISLQEDDDGFSSLETLTMAKGSISTLYNLVCSLLNWARKEKGLSQFEPTTFNVNVELEKIRSIYLHQLTFKRISFDASVPEHIQIYADKNMFHAVLRNIITNAIKFTSKNGKINVSFTSSSEFDEICVTDNGIGISDENLRLMREGKITSQKGTSSELGTGLGVLFVKDIMAAHGGQLVIKSKQGKGSTFCLQFPKN